LVPFAALRFVSKGGTRVLQEYHKLHCQTFTMQHSPSWKANSTSLPQEIPRILWNPKADYSAHENPLLEARLNVMTAIRTLLVYLKPSGYVMHQQV